ncbi:MAG: OsmC family protein [Spirochaetota bacterium]
MGARQHMRGQFTPTQWQIQNDRDNTITIGRGQDAFVPYDLLLGALESCLFSTFNDVVQKMHLSYEQVDMEVFSEKRDADVATLETCSVQVSVTGGSDERKLRRAFDIATRYCSVYQTISKVASMNWDITFTG